MDIVDGRSAEKALAVAREARALGARRAARPSWYHPALGLSIFVALSSFRVGMPAIGVPRG